jgi:hypothetical protein
MAIETLRSKTLAEAVEFINNKKNDVDHVWVFRKAIFLGSFLPKVFGPIHYDLEEINILIYIKCEDGVEEETICINNEDFLEYTLDYV